MNILTFAILMLFLTPGLFIFLFIAFVILMLLGLWVTDGVRKLNRVFKTWSYS